MEELQLQDLKNMEAAELGYMDGASSWSGQRTCSGGETKGETSETRSRHRSQRSSQRQRK